MDQKQNEKICKSIIKILAKENCTIDEAQFILNITKDVITRTTKVQLDHEKLRKLFK